jgi:ABC-type Fe3+-hydroxamate transport system substrate-binding protein
MSNVIPIDVVDPLTVAVQLPLNSESIVTSNWNEVTPMAGTLELGIELNALAGDPEIPRLTKLSPGLDSVTVITTVSPAPGSEGSAERLIGLMISRGGIPVNVPGYKLLRKQIAVAG